MTAIRVFRRLMMLMSVVCVGTVQAASAQVATTPPPDDELRSLAKRILTESKIVPLTRASGSGASSPEPSVELLAGTEGTVGKARFGYLIAENIAVDVSVSGPVRGTTATFWSLDGLRGETTATGALRLFLHRKYRAGASTTGRQMQARTIASGGSGDTIDAFEALFLDAKASALTLTGRHQQQFREERSLAPETPISRQELRQAFADEFRAGANDRGGLELDWALLFSLSGSASRPSFVVANTEGFSSVTHKGQDVSTTLGVVKSRHGSSGGFYVGAGFSQGRSFSGSSRQVCLPSSKIVNASECRDALTADPTSKKHRVTHLDARWYVEHARLALGVRVSHDREAKSGNRSAIDIPVFFLRNSKDMKSALNPENASLSGGVTAGVREVNGRWQWVASFSVGTVFKLPGL